MGKQSQRDKKDIQFLDQLAAKNEEHIKTPLAHWLIMVGVGCITTALPITLFFTQYYHADSLLEAAPQFTIGTLVAAGILAFAVNKWAVETRKTLHAEREAVLSTKPAVYKALLKKSAFIERCASQADLQRDATPRYYPHSKL